MATPVSDTFSDTSGTNLESHTPDVGGTWVQHGSYVGAKLQISSANRCRKENAAAAACYYNNADPGADNYEISVLVRVLSTGSVSYPGLAGRIATAANTMYFARYVPDPTNLWQLYKLVAGVATSLGTWAETLGAGSERTARFVLGAAYQALYVDGTLRISATDGDITSRGYAGIRDGSATIGDNAAGVHLDQFIVVNSIGGYVYRANQ